MPYEHNEFKLRLTYLLPEQGEEKFVTTFLDENLSPQVKDDGCDWNDGDILCSELESIPNREASSAVAIYCFEPRKSEFISKLIDRSYRYQSTRVSITRRASFSSRHLYFSMS
jgi:hypothetical protein